MLWAALSWLPILGLASQIPLQIDDTSLSTDMDSGLFSFGTPAFAYSSTDDVFTPEDLVQLTRPGEGVANDAGDVVIVSTSKYSIKDKKNKKAIWVASVDSKLAPFEVPLANGGDAFWLDDRTIGHVVSAGEGKPHELFAYSVKFDTQLQVPESPVLIGEFPEGVTPVNFRYTSGTNRLVFSAYVYSDGNLKTVKKQDDAWENRGNSAFVYERTFVRQWDTWRGPKRSSLFTVGLAKGADGAWTLADDFSAPLNKTGHYVPVEPFGGTDDFDISDTHIVYTAKDPQLQPATHTKQNIYIVDFMGSDAPRELTSGKQGATHNPVFSKQGDKVAWLELDQDGYESDRAKLVVYDIKKNVRFTLTQSWDRSPASVVFSSEGSYLYFTAADEAHVKLFALPVPPTPSQSSTDPSLPPESTTPVALTTSHAASGIQALPGGRILFTQSSFTSPNDVFVIRGLKNVKTPLHVDQVTSFTADALGKKGLDPAESITFEGAEGKTVQAWVFKPKGFKEGVKKGFPVIFLIHGGPQGAWEDQWSNRWNPNVFAQQGYFVIAPNPTGSTSFGQDFIDAITEDWGGKPFVDMQKGWKYALDKYPEIDPERAVAAGASWGGFAINWIQGHPEFGFGFKALVCHDGVFNANFNGFSTDELFFFDHEFGGKPYENKTKQISEKYSPSNYVHKWSTPQLIFHGSKDYRLPETEGIAAFHALQMLEIPSRLVIFPDENHWVLNHGNSLKWHYEIFEWFDRFVGKNKSQQ